LSKFYQFFLVLLPQKHGISLLIPTISNSKFISATFSISIYQIYVS